VNCAAFTEPLLEIELFGDPEALTAAQNSKAAGAFHAAAGGSLFLDDVTEAPAGIQIKILRALQQRTLKVAGGSKEKRVDVRVLGATTMPVEQILQSSFRKDLLYRMSIVTINIPPLRDRPEDIPHLANHFLRKFNRRQGKKLTLPEETLEWMMALPWPGNARELENAIERAVTMNTDGEIRPEDISHFAVSQQFTKTISKSKELEDDIKRLTAELEKLLERQQHEPRESLASLVTAARSLIRLIEQLEKLIQTD